MTGAQVLLQLLCCFPSKYSENLQQIINNKKCKADDSNIFGGRKIGYLIALCQNISVCELSSSSIWAKQRNIAWF